MNIIKLNESHTESIKPLFNIGTHKNSLTRSDLTVIQYDLELFTDTYMSNLSSYHAFGLEVDNEIKTVIGFYESTDDACWYLNQVRSSTLSLVKLCLDAVIEYNEVRGRLKFYSVVPAKYKKVYRKLAFSDMQNERYGSYDEYIVPSKNQCIYTMPWQVLYNRTLSPIDTVVKCSFLKEQYRKKIIIGGNI